MKRIIVGISGASGTIRAIRLLEALRPMKDVEVHLVDCMVGRMLQWIGIENKLVKVWQGLSTEKQ